VWSTSGSSCSSNPSGLGTHLPLMLRMQSRHQRGDFVARARVDGHEAPQQLRQVLRGPVQRTHQLRGQCEMLLIPKQLGFGI
jgi:hypothetical protein